MTSIDTIHTCIYIYHFEDNDIEIIYKLGMLELVLKIRWMSLSTDRWMKHGKKTLRYSSTQKKKMVWYSYSYSDLFFLNQTIVCSNFVFERELQELGTVIWYYFENILKKKKISQFLDTKSENRNANKKKIIFIFVEEWENQISCFLIHFHFLKLIHPVNIFINIRWQFYLLLYLNGFI